MVHHHKPERPVKKWIAVFRVKVIAKDVGKGEAEGCRCNNSSFILMLLLFVILFVIFIFVFFFFLLSFFLCVFAFLFFSI